MALELDHVFVFVAPDAPEAAVLEESGWRESFRRDHPGQGTTNACYCFDNAYLELIWLCDRKEAETPPVARLQLAARAEWQSSVASPFGIGFRADLGEELPFSTWDYAAPYGFTIPIAEASDDARQPLLFQVSGAARPDGWTDGRPGSRQTGAGLAEIVHLRLDLPDGVCPAKPLTRLAEIGLLSIGHAPAHRLILTLSCPGNAPRRLSLPDFTFSRS
ncbi:MAG: VOC family protein [Pseudomonadota bacterium]